MRAPITFNAVRQAQFVDSVAIWGAQVSLDGEVRAMMLPVQMEARHDGDANFSTSPMMDLRRSEAIALMDALWAAGIRPSNGEGSVGEIGAIRDHLKDMRRLVFEKEVKP